MRKIVLLVFCAVLFPAQTVCAASPHMEAGNWEIVTSIKAEDMPFPIPSMKLTRCYTRTDIENSKNPAAGEPNNKNECTIKDQKMTRSKATWSVACKDGSKGSGEASYNGNTFSSTIKFTDKSFSATTTSIKGRHLGDCK